MIQFLKGVAFFHNKFMLFQLLVIRERILQEWSTYYSNNPDITIGDRFSPYFGTRQATSNKYIRISDCEFWRLYKECAVRLEGTSSSTLIENSIFYLCNSLKEFVSAGAIYAKSSNSLVIDKYGSSYCNDLVLDHFFVQTPNKLQFSKLMLLYVEEIKKI